MANAKMKIKEYLLLRVQRFLQGRGYVLASSLELFRRKHPLVFDRIDYIRLASLSLIAQKINAERLVGNVAELGVFRGEFARNINALFPDRKLYLFDTFEGFDERDTSVETVRSFSKARAREFSGTSADFVLSQMQYPDNCVIKKGYFPKTAEGVHDSFVFVNIDTDLYKPIYDGLHFFYPLLVRGGYIFVHDFNNPTFNGAHEAICQFRNETKTNHFPLCDGSGSAVFVK